MVDSTRPLPVRSRLSEETARLDRSLFWFTRTEILPDRAFTQSVPEKQEVRELVLEGADPWSSSLPFRVRAELRGPAALTKRTVILLPPTGGLSPLDKALAREIADEGKSCIALRHFTGDSEASIDWDVHQRGLVRGITATRWIIDWARKQGARTFGLCAASMGALHAAFAAILENTVSRTALIAAGAPVWEIAAFSEHKIVSQIREKRWKEYQISSMEEYRHRLREAIPFDLADFAQPRKGRSDLMIVSPRDHVIPAWTQRQLAKLLEPDFLLEFNNSHIWTILRAQLFHKHLIISHLLEDH